MNANAGGTRARKPVKTRFSVAVPVSRKEALSQTM